MAQTSFALMTNLGRAKEAAALANATTIEITHIAIGDGVTVPSGGETELYNEVARKTISGHGTVVGAANVAYFDCYLAADDGPYTIREAGLIDDEGDLIAIAKYDPPISKPIPSSGQTVEGTVRLEVAFSDIANITIKVDPAMMVALQRLTRLPWVPVISMSLATPPVGPQVGDTYVIAASPTGAWVGQAGKLAEHTVAGWAIIDPPDGHGVGLPDGSAWVRVAGAYVPLADRITRALALSCDLAVKGVQNAPPGAPAEGDVWIVGTAGSGAWAGKSNQIAVLIGGAWVFLSPVTGVQANYKSGVKFAMVWWNGTAWKALSSLNAITAPTTLNISTTGSASPVDPLTGDAFDTLANVMIWLRDWSIIGAGSVTIQYSAGVHTQTSQLSVSHPNASRISIKGAALPGAFPVPADSVATLATARANLRAKMGTVISIQGASGFLFDGPFQAIETLMFDHNGAGAGSIACATQRAGEATYRQCVFFGCELASPTGAGLAASIGGSALAIDCLVSHCNTGVRPLQNGYIGLSVANQTYTAIMDCGYGILAGSGGQISSGSLHIRRAANVAIMASLGGFVAVTNGTLWIADNAVNTQTTGGRIDVASTVAATIGTASGTSHIASVGGYVSVPNTGDITSSPANNTVGSNNSYVRVY